MQEALGRFFDGDVWHSFRSSPVAMAAAVVAALCVFCAAFAPWVAPHDPLTDAAIDNNVRVMARGYNAFDPPGNPVGVEAYWISVGGIFAGP